jgi:hypothetical protein
LEFLKFLQFKQKAVGDDLSTNIPPLDKGEQEKSDASLAYSS